LETALKKTTFKRFVTSKEALLYVIAIAMVISFSAWMSLLNNFTVEIAGFNGKEIGMLQSLREIPGLLAFSVVLVLLFVAQQRLVYLSIMMLGLGTAITGLFPSVTGLYLTTVLMSFGFHYLETMNQSLSMQWLDKHKAPIILGKINGAKAFVGLGTLLIIFLLMRFFKIEYKYIYLIFGGITFAIGILAWYFFTHFKETVIQEKKLRLKKSYWLFYVLTLLAGARRQIFVVFAGFLLVEKFKVSIDTMIALLFVNSLINIYLSPKIGKFIAHFGERRALHVEYVSLIVIFASYAFVHNVYLAFALYIIDQLLFSMAISLRTYFQKIVDPKDMSSASAVSFTINHVAAVFLPAVLGLVWLQSYHAVFLIGAAIGLFSLGLSFLVPHKPEKGFETVLAKR
jgi:hypothetical protein